MAERDERTKAAEALQELGIHVASTASKPPPIQTRREPNFESTLLLIMELADLSYPEWIELDPMPQKQASTYQKALKKEGYNATLRVTGQRDAMEIMKYRLWVQANA